MPKQGFWFRGFVQYAREGPGSGKDTRASPHPCVVTQEVDLLSSDATEYGQCSGSDSPCVGGALGHTANAASAHNATQPAIIGAVLFTQEKAPPKRGQLGQQGWRNTTLPPSISSRNMSGRWPQRKSPAETGAKWVMLLANWRGPPRRSNNAGREHWLTRLGRSGAVNRRRDGISPRHKAIAVVLNLMNPVGAGRRAVGK